MGFGSEGNLAKGSCMNDNIVSGYWMKTNTYNLPSARLVEAPSAMRTKFFDLVVPDPAFEDRKHDAAFNQ